MNTAHLLLTVGALILLGACASTSAPSDPVDAAPATSTDTLRRLAALPDPYVVEEPRSLRGNGPVYSVWGKSYRVMDSAAGYREQGIASWYGTKFHGRETSSGEPYDIYKLTAAHKHLPIPSFVRVTNLDNRRSTIVRVNDRGPFHENRVIDLSYAAAVKLGFHDHGTAQVLVETVQAEGQRKQYVVQAGAFSSLDSADRSHRHLAQLTGLPGVVVRTPVDGLYKVQLGPVEEGADLKRVQALLEGSEYGTPRLIQSN